jgi:required for meiotic nuclear division protein 1
VGQNGNEGEVFVFANGSFVAWGLDESEVRKFSREIIDRTAGMSAPKLSEPESEELEFVVDPSELSVMKFCICLFMLNTARPDKLGCRVT